MKRFKNRYKIMLLISIIMNVFLISRYNFDNVNFTTRHNRYKRFIDVEFTSAINLSEYESKIFYIQQPNRWIINHRIAQYSSKIILNEQRPDQLVLETLAQCDFDNQTDEFIRSNVLFLVKYKREFFLLDATTVTGRTTNIKVKDSIRYIYKLSTVVDNQSRLIEPDEIYFALIDYQEFTKLARTHFTHALFLFAYHKPYIYRQSPVKKKAVAHCVHMVRFLNKNNALERLFNWLDIQKSIGIDRIKLYLYDVESNLKQKIASPFVETDDIVTNFRNVCEFQLNLVKNDTTGSYVKRSLLKACENTHGIYLKQLDWGVQTTLELLVSNDCYSGFRYTHEYVSNYDYDELILPTRRDANKLMPGCGLNQTTRYDMYAYIDQLAKNISGNSKKIASFVFNQVLSLENVGLDFLDKLAIASKGSIITENQLKFDIDGQFAGNLTAAKSLIDCLNRSIETKGKLASEFNRPFMVYNHYVGKSIFNTNYTLMINQHYTFETVPDAIEYYVPYNIGYYNHYRHSLNGYYDFSKSIPIGKFLIDLENYSLMASLY